MKPGFTFFCLLIFSLSTLKSQIPTEQDCLGAVLICDPIYSTPNPGYGTGNYPNEVGPGTCQIQGEINSLWFKFTVVSSGDLAFTITPASNMDYDWALYNLSNDSCEDIFTNGSLLSSCNSSQFAVTGISSFGVGNWNSFGLTNAFNYLLPVFSGELYYLQINNYYGVAGGFTIDFTASTAILFDCNSASFGAVQTSLCEKFCTDFFDSTGNNPTSWEWTFEGGIPSTSTLQNPTNICYDIPGSYDVTLIVSNSLGMDTLVLPDYVTVYPTPPFPTITQNGNILTASPAANYQWQFNSVDIAGATNQTYEISESGYYTVVINDSNGCMNSTTLFVTMTNVENLLNDEFISVYPNPSDGHLTVRFDNKYSGSIMIQIYNAIGQLIFSSEEMVTASPWIKELVLPGTVQGVYAIVLKSEDFILKESVIVGSE